MKISAARIAAYEALRRIDKARAFSSVVLQEVEATLLSNIDRGLCHEIVLGVLRRQLFLDRIIDQLTGNKKLDAEVRIVLRLSLYQLLHLDRVPAYSVINEAVKLVNRAKKTSAKGLVNAVLRNASRSVPELDYENELEHVSIETSHPEWLLKKWTHDRSATEAYAIAKANNEETRLAFRLTAKGRRENFEDKLCDFDRSDVVDSCFYANTDRQILRDFADSNLIYFQDEGSQLVGSVVDLRPGDRFFDVCAAPGSKTTQIAARFDNHLLAGDISRPRLAFLHENCRAQGADSVSVLEYDAEKTLPLEESGFDWVLLDVPCTGTGTIRSNPEIRYLLDPNDVAEMSSKQLRILENASRLLKVGGKIVYSTCSIEKEENEMVCSAFLEQNARFSKSRPTVAERFLTAGDFARSHPSR
ncbi:MAG: 16S rRNA (cytosine(967)-C(5))-methyltransferase RsmB, partial [Pyrinomonadaceae bacterium]